MKYFYFVSFLPFLVLGTGERGIFNNGDAFTHIFHQEPMDLVGYVDGKVYFTKLNLENASWHEWTFICQRTGLFTASIESQAQYDIVIKFLGNLPSGIAFWLGAWDINSEQNFYWMRTGKPMNYSNWNAGYGSPRNDTQFNCAYVAAGGFVDVPCTTLWRPLCEYP